MKKLLVRFLLAMCGWLLLSWSPLSAADLVPWSPDRPAAAVKACDCVPLCDCDPVTHCGCGGVASLAVCGLGAGHDHHTHTCANGHTWDHSVTSGHSCPACGISQFVQDSYPRRVNVGQAVSVRLPDPTQAAIQPFSLAQCENGACRIGSRVAASVQPWASATSSYRYSSTTSNFVGSGVRSGAAVGRLGKPFMERAGPIRSTFKLFGRRCG